MGAARGAGGTQVGRTRMGDGVEECAGPDRDEGLGCMRRMAHAYPDLVCYARDPSV